MDAIPSTDHPDPHRSLGLAYVLLLLGGIVGAHRFYLKRYASGAAQLALFVMGGTLFFVFGLGLVLLVPLVAWLVADAFLLPRMARELDEPRASRATRQPPPVAAGARR